ncbi:MAG: hypothetical protein JWR80_7534 [Bradyrhizobium sp.]|nr:hypothetical protein [Bradyrhizobium sp.]
MIPVAANLALSILCGLAFGFAARKGGLCMIVALEHLVDDRSPRLLLSFLHTSAWVALVTLPMVLLWVPSARTPAYALAASTIIGGVLFGLSAAINGACSIGTLEKLSGGELSFLATISGMAIGFWLAAAARDVLPAPSPSSFAPLATFAAAGIGAALLVLAWRFRRVIEARPVRLGHWSPERAALVLGVSGGLLYVLHGAWAYSLVIDRLVTGTIGGVRDLPVVLAVLAATVGGAMLGALHDGTFAPGIRWRLLPQRLIGGTGMGYGASLVPGGNDAVLLHGLPSLSPHAAPAFAAMVTAAACGLLLTRRLTGAWQGGQSL